MLSGEEPRFVESRFVEPRSLNRDSLTPDGTIKISGITFQVHHFTMMSFWVVIEVGVTKDTMYIPEGMDDASQM